MATDPLLLAAAAALIAATGLAGIVVAVDRLLPARFVRERHDLALAALIVIPLVFLLALRAAPDMSAADPAAASGQPQAMTAEISQEAARPTSTAGPVAAVTMPEAVSTDVWAVLGPVLLWVWLAGSAVMTVRLARDLVALVRMRSAARTVACPPGMRLSADLPLAVSDAVATPLLAGYRRPQILLPLGFTFDHAARPVLEHEIAHARRGDAWTVLALRVLQVCLWWVLPLLPLMALLERNRETLCDREAARITGQSRDLALALIDAASDRTRHASLVLAAAPSRSSLAHRVGRLAATSDLTRKDSPMRLVLLLPALSATALVLTPQFGEAGAMDGRDDRPSSARDLDDALDLDGRLYQASRRGQAGRVGELLAGGANPDIRYRGDGTALIAAVRGGDAETVATLLQAGANPDLGIDGDGNPMIAAAVRGRDDLVQQLLAAGANVDAEQRGDGNALIAASGRGHVDTVDLLLAAGADPDAYVFHDETPLVNAAQRGHLDVMERLAEAGADLSLTVRARDRRGREIYRSPLSEARRTGQGHVVAWLEARGAEHRPPSE
ncbi:ankyrin repeat domain-containing protein [Maricaulis sp.]|uniref:ankyrin repeat domain-containing protein n=1 Tax=Maricaulis sp. TaxID=1486257 RepID=UPI002B27BD53|nr:ankyrin repeat domain-containing protein [Maricaulis sp.]